MVSIKPVKINKRGNSFQLYYYNPYGERRRLSIGTDNLQAQRMAVRFTDWLLEGKDPELEIKKAPQKERAKAVTLKDLFPIFMVRHGKFRSKAMQINYRNSFKNICRCNKLSNAYIDSIKKGLVLDYANARIEDDKVKPATVNRELSFLKCMLSQTVEWNLLDNSPLKGLKLLPESGKRDVDLTDQQITALLKELPEPIANIAEFAIYSGIRKENILSLKIESIRFHEHEQSGEIKLIEKGDKKALKPIPPQAVAVLKRVINGGDEGFVFINPGTGTRYKCIHKTFDRVVRKLGLTVTGSKLRFHDLRHVFATRLLRAGASLDMVRYLLGHKDRSTTDRYTTVDMNYIGNALSLMPTIRGTGNKKSLASDTPRILNLTADTY